MSIKLGSNIASMTAQRRLGEASDSLSKIYERLSSGQRINRASDDAAGLAIADSLNSKARISAQAIRNGNDGVSLLNIADSAVETLSDLVVRIRELAEQAANGTYSTKQRAALDAEAQQLSKEFTRITQTTGFNGIKIFNGSLGTGLSLQLGEGVSAVLNATIGGNIGTGDLDTMDTYLNPGDSLSTSAKLGDLNGDGFLDLVNAGISGSQGKVTIRLGNGDGTFGSSTSYTAELGASYSVTLGDLNGDGALDLISAGSDVAGGKITIRLGNGNGTFGNATSYTSELAVSNSVTLGDLNGDGALDLVSAGTGGGSGKTTIRFGNGNGSFGNATSYTSELGETNSVSLGDLNGDGFLDLVSAGFGGGSGKTTIRLGNGNGTFGNATSYTSELGYSNSVTLGDLNSDGILDLISAGHGGGGAKTTVRLGNNDGTFGNSTSYTSAMSYVEAVSLGDLNGDAILDMISVGGYNGLASVRLGNGNGTFGAATSYTTESITSFSVDLGDLDSDGVLDVVTAGYHNSIGYMGAVSVRLGKTQDGLGGLTSFSLKTRSGALQAMGALEHSVANLSKQRGQIGASLSRIGVAISNLQTSAENFKAAESRIRDVDIAAESANLVRTQILQQAASSVLAQANQAPALALTLLG